MGIVAAPLILTDSPPGPSGPSGRGDPRRSLPLAARAVVPVPDNPEVPETVPTHAPTPEQVAEFLRLVRAWIWADRMRREVQEPTSAPLPPAVARLLAPYRVEGASDETIERWAERAVNADSEERGTARKVVAAGQQLALALEAHGFDSRPVLLVVHAANGGGGVATLAGTWPQTRVEIERVGLRLKVGASAPGAAAVPPAIDPAPVAASGSVQSPAVPPKDEFRFILDLDPEGLRHVVANGKRLSYADSGRGGELTKRHTGAAFLVALATGRTLPHLRPDALEDLRRALERGTDQGLTITGGPESYAFSAPVTVTQRLLRHFAGRTGRQGTSRAR